MFSLVSPHLSDGSCSGGSGGQGSLSSDLKVKATDSDKDCRQYPPWMENEDKIKRISIFKSGTSLKTLLPLGLDFLTMYLWPGPTSLFLLQCLVQEAFAYT